MNTKRVNAINSIVLNDESKYQIGVINPSALTPYNPPIQIGVISPSTTTPYKSPIQIGVTSPSAFTPYKPPIQIGVINPVLNQMG
jgi:hypothetical protein